MAKPTGDLKEKIDAYVKLEVPGYTDEFAIMADINGDDELMQEYIKGFEETFKFTLDDDARSYMVEKTKAQTPRGLEQSRLELIQTQSKSTNKMPDVEQEAQKYARDQVQKLDVDDPSTNVAQLHREFYEEYIFGKNAPNLPNEFKNEYLNTGDAVDKALQSPLFEKPEYTSPLPFGFPTNYLISQETVSRKHVQPSDQSQEQDPYDYFEERMEEAARLDELKEELDYSFLGTFVPNVIGNKTIDEDQAAAISKQINESIQQDPEKRRALQEFKLAYESRGQLINELTKPEDFSPNTRDELARLSHKMHIALRVLEGDAVYKMLNAESISNEHSSQLKDLLAEGSFKQRGSFDTYTDKLLTNPKEFYNETGLNLFPKDQSLANLLQIEEDNTSRSVYQELDKIEEELSFRLGSENAQEQGLFLSTQARKNLLLDIENEMENLKVEFETKKDEDDFDKLRQLNKLRQQVEDLGDDALYKKLPGGGLGLAIGDSVLNDYILGSVDAMSGETLEETLKNVANFDKLLNTDSDLKLEDVIESHIQLLQLTDTIAKISEADLDQDLKDIQDMTPKEFMSSYGGRKFKELPILLQSKMYRRITDTRPYKELQNEPVRDIEMNLLKQDLETFVFMRLGILKRSKAGAFGKYVAEELMFQPTFNPITSEFTQSYTTTGYAFQYLLPMAQTYISEAVSGLVETEDTTPAMVGAAIGALGYLGAAHPLGASVALSGYLGGALLGGIAANEMMSEDLPTLTSRVEASLKLGEVGVGSRAYHFAEKLGIEDPLALETIYSVATFGEFYNFEKIFNPFNQLPIASTATRLRSFRNTVSEPEGMVVEFIDVRPRVKRLETARQDLPAKVSATEYIETPTRFMSDVGLTVGLLVGGASFAPGLLPMTALFREQFIAGTAPKTRQLRPYTVTGFEKFFLNEEEQQMLATRLVDRQKREEQRNMVFDDVDLRRMSIVNDLKAAEQKGINLKDLYDKSDYSIQTRIKKMYQSLATEELSFDQFLARLDSNHQRRQLQAADLAIEYDLLVESLPNQIKNTDEFKRRATAIEDTNLTPEQKVSLEMMNAYHISLAMHINADNPTPIYKALSTNFENFTPLYQYKPENYKPFLGDVRSAKDLPSIVKSLDNINEKDAQIVSIRGLDVILKQEKELNGYPVSFVEDLITDKAQIKDYSLTTAKNQTEIGFRGTSYDEFPVFVKTFYDDKYKQIPEAKKTTQEIKAKSDKIDKFRGTLVQTLREESEQFKFVDQKFSKDPTKYAELETEITNLRNQLNEIKQKEQNKGLVKDLQDQIAEKTTELKEYKTKINNQIITFGKNKTATLRMKNDANKKETTLLMVSGRWMDETWESKDNIVVQDFNWRFKSVTHALEYAAIRGNDTLVVPLGERGLFQQTFGEGRPFRFQGRSKDIKSAETNLSKIDEAMTKALQKWLGEDNVAIEPDGTLGQALVLKTSAIVDKIPLERYLQDRKGPILKMKFKGSVDEPIQTAKLVKEETPSTELKTLKEMQKSFKETPSVLTERINQLENAQSRLRVTLDDDAKTVQTDTDVSEFRTEKTDTRPEQKILSVVINGQPVRLITRDSEITTKNRTTKTLVIDDVEVPGKTNEGAANGTQDVEKQLATAFKNLEIVHDKFKNLTEDDAVNRLFYIKNPQSAVEADLDPAVFAEFLYTNKEKQKQFSDLHSTNKAIYDQQLQTDLTLLRDFFDGVVPDLLKKKKEDVTNKQVIINAIRKETVNILNQAQKEGSFDLFNQDFFLDMSDAMQKRILLNDIKNEYNTSIDVVQGAIRLLTHAIADGYEAFAFNNASRSMQYLFNDQLRKAGSSHKLEYVSVENTYELFGVIDLAGQRKINSVFEFANTLDDKKISIALTDPDIANLFSIVPPEGTINYAKMPRAKKASVQAMTKWLMLGEKRTLQKPEDYAFIINSSKQLYLGLSKQDLLEQQKILKTQLKTESVKKRPKYREDLRKELKNVETLLSIYRQNPKMFSNSDNSILFEFTYDGKKFSGIAQQTKNYQTRNRGNYTYLTDLELPELTDRQRSLVYSRFAREAASKGFDGLMLPKSAENHLKPIADAWGVQIKEDEFTFSYYDDTSIPTVLLEFTEPMVESLVNRSNLTVLRKPNQNFYQVSARSFLEALNNPNEVLRVQSELGDISINVVVNPDDITNAARAKLEQALMTLVETVDRYSFQDMTFDSALTDEIKNYPKDFRNDILNHLYNEAVADVYKQTLEGVFSEEGIEATIEIQTPKIRRDRVDAHTVIKRLGFANDTNIGFVSKKLDAADTTILENAPEATPTTRNGEQGFNITVNPVREYNTGGLRQIDLIAMAEGVGLDDFVRSVQPKFQKTSELADPKQILKDMKFDQIADDADALNFLSTGQLTAEFLNSETHFIKHSSSRQSRLAGLLYYLWKKRREVPPRRKDLLLYAKKLDEMPDKPIELSSDMQPQVLALLEESNLGFYKLDPNKQNRPTITINPDMSFDDFLFVNSFLLLGTLPKKTKKLLLGHYDNAAGVLTPRGMRQFAQEQINYMKTGEAPTFNVLKIFEHNKEIFDRMWQMSKSRVRDNNMGLYIKWNHIFGHHMRKENYVYTHLKGRKLSGAEAIRFKSGQDPIRIMKKEMITKPDDPDRLMVRFNNPLYSPKYEGTKIVGNKFSIRLSEFKEGDRISDTDFMIRLIGESVVDDYIDQKINANFRLSEKFTKITERTMVPISQKAKFERIALTTQNDLLGQQIGDQVVLQTRLMTEQEIKNMSELYPQESFSSSTQVIRITEHQLETLHRFLNIILAERYARIPAKGTTLESLTDRDIFRKRLNTKKEAFITSKEQSILQDVILDSQVQTPMSRKTYDRLNRNFLQRAMPNYVKMKGNTYLPPLTYDPFDEQNFVTMLTTVQNTNTINIDMIPMNIRAAATRYNRSLSKIVEDFKKLAREIKNQESNIKTASRQGEAERYKQELGKYGRRQQLMMNSIERYFKIPYDPEKVSTLYKISEDFDTVTASNVARQNESILQRLQKMGPDEAAEYLTTLQLVLQKDKMLKESVSDSLEKFRLKFVTQADVNSFDIQNAFTTISTELSILKGSINEFSDLLYETLTGKQPGAIEILAEKPSRMNLLRRQLYNIYTSGYWFKNDIKKQSTFKPFVDGDDFKTRTLSDFTDENVRKYLGERIDSLSLSPTRTDQMDFVKIYNDVFLPTKNVSKLDQDIDIVNKLMSTNDMDFETAIKTLSDGELLKRSDPLSIIGQIAINSRLLELRRRFADDLIQIGSPELNSLLSEYQKVPENLMSEISDLADLKDRVIQRLNDILEYTANEQTARGKRAVESKILRNRLSKDARKIADSDSDLDIIARLIAEDIVAKLDIKQRLPTGEKIKRMVIEGKEFVVPESVEKLIEAMEQQTVSPGASLGSISGVDIAELRINQSVETKLRILGLPDEDITDIETNVARSKVIAQKYQTDLILFDALKAVTLGLLSGGVTEVFAPGSGALVGSLIAGHTVIKRTALRDGILTYLYEKLGARVSNQQVEQFIHNLYLRQIPHLSESEQAAILQLMIEASPKSRKQEALQNQAQSILSDFRSNAKGLAKQAMTSLLYLFAGQSLAHPAILIAASFLDKQNTSLTRFFTRSEQRAILNKTQTLIRDRINGKAPTILDADYGFTSTGLQKAMNEYDYSSSVWRDYKEFLDTYPEDLAPDDNPKYVHIRNEMKRDYEAYLKQGDMSIKESFRNVLSDLERDRQSLYNSFKMIVTALSGRAYLMNNMVGALFNDQITRGYMNIPTAGILAGAFGLTSLGMGIPGLLGGMAAGKLIGDSIQAYLMKNSSRDLYSGHGYLDRPKQISQVIAAFQETNFSTTLTNTAATMTPIPLLGLGPVLQGSGATFLSYFNEGGIRTTFKPYDNFINPENFPPVITPSGRIYTYEDIIELVTTHGVNTTYVREETGRAFASEIRNLYPDKFTLTDLNTRFNRAMLETAEMMDLYFRIGMFINELEKGTHPEQAGLMVRSTFYDYSQLTPHEKAIGRSMFTFYAFMRRNASFMLENLIKNPDRFMGVLRFQRSSLKRDYDKHFPELSQSDLYNFRMPLNFIGTLKTDVLNDNGEAMKLEDGRGLKKIIPYSAPLPYTDLFKMLPGLSPDMEYVTYMFSQMNPAIGLAYAGITGNQLFGNRPLDQYLVNPRTHNFLRLTFDGYRADKDAPLQFQVVGLEEMYKTRLGEGKRRTDTTMQRMAYRPNSSALLNNISVQAGRRPKDQLTLFALEQIILPTLYAYPAGKVIQPFTGAGRAGKMQENIDRLDYASDQQIKYAFALFYNGLLDRLKSEAPRILNNGRQEAYQILLDEGNKEGEITTKQVMDKMVEMAGFDPNKNEDLFIMMDFYQKSPHAEEIYEASLYGAPVDMLFSDEQVHEQNMQNFYYDLLKENK